MSMSGKEGFHGYSKELFENKSEIQPQEPQLEQPEVAEHARDIIDAFKKGLKRTPQFVDAAADHYINSQRGKVYYEKEEGGPEYSVDLRTDIEGDYKINSETDHAEYFETRRFERLDFSKVTVTPEGGYTRRSLYALSEYIDNKPSRGRIIVNHAPQNTASSVQEARDFFRAEFDDPQPQTPPQK